MSCEDIPITKRIIFFSPKKCFTACMLDGYKYWKDMQIRRENTLLLWLVFDGVSEIGAISIMY